MRYVTAITALCLLGFLLASGQGIGGKGGVGGKGGFGGGVVVCLVGGACCDGGGGGGGGGGLLSNPSGSKWVQGF